MQPSGKDLKRDRWTKWADTAIGQKVTSWEHWPDMERGGQGQSAVGGAGQVPGIGCCSSCPAPQPMCGLTEEQEWMGGETSAGVWGGGDQLLPVMACLEVGS